MKRVVLSFMAIAMALTAAVAQPESGQGRQGEGGRPGGQGGRSGGQGGDQQQMMMNFMRNPMGSMGYFEIDEDDAEKKLKFAKSDKVKEDQFENILEKYDDSIDKFEDQYAAQIKEVEAMKEKIEDAREMGDMQSVRPLMKEMAPKTKEMREKLREIHKTLAADLNAILTVNENKKWMSYYMPLCKSNSYSPMMSKKGGKKTDRK